MKVHDTSRTERKIDFPFDYSIHSLGATSTTVSSEKHQEGLAFLDKAEKERRTISIGRQG